MSLCGFVACSACGSRHRRVDRGRRAARSARPGGTSTEEPRCGERDRPTASVTCSHACSPQCDRAKRYRLSLSSDRGHRQAGDQRTGRPDDEIPTTTTTSGREKYTRENAKSDFGRDTPPHQLSTSHIACALSETHHDRGTGRDAPHCTRRARTDRGPASATPVKATRSARIGSLSRPHSSLY